MTMTDERKKKLSEIIEELRKSHQEDKATTASQIRLCLCEKNFTTDPSMVCWKCKKGKK